MRRRAWMLALGSLIAPKAFALNILLSNDDGYQHPNIRALYTVLKAQGHTVRIAAPQSDQSARGGAFYFGREVTVGHDSDPAYPDSYFIATTEKGLCQSPDCAGKDVQIAISGTPVMAVLMGLNKVLPHPDLVIVGPNPGNNLGAINMASGTFNAASVALQAGIPALAVSTDLKEPDPQRAALLVASLVKALEQHRQSDGALLPPGVGLNINLPKGTQIKGVKFTRIGSYVGFEALYTDDLKQFNLPGKAGIGFQYSRAASAAQQHDEAVWLNQGYLTISAFSGLPESISVSPALKQQVAHEVHP